MSHWCLSQHSNHSITWCTYSVLDKGEGNEWLWMYGQGKPSRLCDLFHSVCTVFFPIHCSFYLFVISPLHFVLNQDTKSRFANMDWDCQKTGMYEKHSVYLVQFSAKIPGILINQNNYSPPTPPPNHLIIRCYRASLEWLLLFLYFLSICTFFLNVYTCFSDCLFLYIKLYNLTVQAFLMVSSNHNVLKSAIVC